MKNWIWIVVVVAVTTAIGAQDAKKPKGIFSMLKVGQAVSLKDHGTAYSISFMEPEVPLCGSEGLFSPFPNSCTFFGLLWTLPPHTFSKCNLYFRTTVGKSVN